MERKMHRLAVRLGLPLVLVLVAAACSNGGGTDGSGGSTGGGGGGGGGTTDSSDGGSDYEDPSIGVYASRIDWGVVTDLTGPTTATQVPWSTGLQAYIDFVNEQGGVHGRQINLVMEDDQFDIAQGQQAYERLVNYPVFGLSGINNSGLQVAIADQIRNSEIPTVGSITTTRDIVAPFNPYYFASWCSFADMADVAVPYMADLTGSTDGPRVVAAALDVASGVEWTDEVERVVQLLGGEVTKILQPAGAVDASAEARAIEAFAPDFVAVHGSPPSAQALLTAMAERGLSSTPTIGIANIAVGSIWQDLANVDQEMGESFHVMHCYTPPVVADADANADLVQAATATDMLGQPMFTGGWLVGSVIVAGLEAAGPEPTREAFIAALEGAVIDTGDLSADVAYTSDDHQAFQTTRPYRYDYDANQFVPIGEYSDYEDFITDAYRQG